MKLTLRPDCTAVSSTPLLTGFSGHLVKAKKPLPRNFHTCTKYRHAALREGLTPGSISSRELTAATSHQGSRGEHPPSSLELGDVGERCPATANRAPLRCNPETPHLRLSALPPSPPLIWTPTADTQPSVDPLTPSMTQPGLPASRQL